MNRKYIVSIGVVVSMLSGIASAGFVNDGFTAGNGTALHGRDQWQATHATSVMISNNAAAIPILQTLSNNVAPLSDAKVWTDFWTIPRPFVSATDAAPAVDPNTSAMFFISNTSWAVVHGLGGAYTNVYGQDIWGSSHPVPNDGSTWQHVSVFHNYTSGKWSLFVDGKPVMTNMAFINSSVPNYQWFSVQNGGGNASNVTWVDDVLITNRVPASLTNDHHSDGVRDAWELMYYGTIGVVSPTADTDGDGYNNSQESKLGADPAVLSPSEPGGTNILEYVFNSTAPGIESADMTNSWSPAIRLIFNVGPNRTCELLGSAVPSGFGRIGAGLIFSDTNSIVDENALNRGNDYYYCFKSTDPLTGFTATNSEIYVFHKRSVGSSTTNYWIGLMADYGSSNTLGSTLGQHLARGLNRGAEGVGDWLTLYYPDETTFYLTPSGTWRKKTGNAGSADTNTPISVGQAVLIARTGNSGSLNGSQAVFVGPMLPTNGAAVPLVANGWNLLAWPYDGGSSTSWNLTNGVPDNVVSNSDRLWIRRGEVYTQFRRWGDGGWYSVPGNRTPDASTAMRFGDGAFYFNKGVAPTTWRP